MTIRNVGELRAALEDFPDYYPLRVEVTVGGDLVTDTVDLAEVTATTDTYAGGTTVVLVPAEDPYDVRGLIDDGLAARDT